MQRNEQIKGYIEINALIKEKKVISFGRWLKQKKYTNYLNTYNKTIKEYKVLRQLLQTHQIIH